MAVNTETDAPDLNAIADLVLGGLLQIDELGRIEAKETIAGTCHAPGQGNSTLRLEITGEVPGITVSTLNMGSTDWLASIALQAGMSKTAYLDMRLYPTNLEHRLSDHQKQQVFQAVIADKSALVDAGTPTCVSWNTIDVLERAGEPLDRFIIGFDNQGVAAAVIWSALGYRYERAA